MPPTFTRNALCYIYALEGKINKILNDQWSNTYSYSHLCQTNFLSPILINTSSLLCLNFPLDVGCRTLTFPIRKSLTKAFVFEMFLICSIQATIQIWEAKNYGYYFIYTHMYINTSIQAPATFRTREHMQMYFVLLFIIRSFYSIIREYDLTELHPHHIITLCTVRAFLNDWIKAIWLYSSYYTHFLNVFWMFRFRFIFCQFQTILKFSSNV